MSALLSLLEGTFISVDKENTSYSAMLNIVEPVPPTELIPSNSRNSVYHFQYNSGIPGISSYQFLGTPGIPSDSGIE
jgi:hypothetical protein